jgi:two-component system response regulator GlrR
MEQEHILVIDDEEGLLQLVKMRLNAMGFTVTACTSGREAVNAAKTNRFDLAITDLRLRGEDGLDVTEELLRIHPGLPVIILTAHGSIPNAVEAVQRGAFGYLTKPFDDKELKAKIEEGLSPQRMSREIQRLKSLVNELYGMENVVARSPAMQRLLQQVIQVADSDATMLLFGETGTGKEVFARVTHANSRRSKGPFVALNCAAIPETLFESELFGHVRGAFTSAHGPKKVCSKVRTEARCFSMKSERCRSLCRSSSCALYRSERCGKSVPNIRAKSMSGSSRRPIRIWAKP